MKWFLCSTSTMASLRTRRRTSPASLSSCCSCSRALASGGLADPLHAGRPGREPAPRGPERPPLRLLARHHASLTRTLARAARASSALRARSSVRSSSTGCSDGGGRSSSTRCIHPTDRAKIRAGIDGLGEAIERSDRVLVLADEHYFTRLWCVFELASFLHLHTAAAAQENEARATTAPTTAQTTTVKRAAARITISPLQVGTFAFGMYLTVWIGCFAFGILSNLLHSYGFIDCTRPLDFFLLWTLVGSPVWWLPKTLFCASFFKARREMERQLALFSVAKAQCLMPEDRLQVEDTIRRWFGSLDAFETAVHGSADGKDRGLLGLLHDTMGSADGPLALDLIFFESMPAFHWKYDGLALANDMSAVVRAFTSASASISSSTLCTLPWSTSVCGSFSTPRPPPRSAPYPSEHSLSYPSSLRKFFLCGSGAFRTCRKARGS